MDSARSDQSAPVNTPADITEAGGWYPDPARLHELRYFNGQAWTDDVADAGKVADAPLGPVRPGLLGWPSPSTMMAKPTGLPPLAEVPRVKMWILAVLSLSVFWIGTPPHRIVLPLGVAFAIWCWRATTDAYTSHKRAVSPDFGAIQAARRVAVALAALSVLQVAIWIH
jgi:hypothetical protein